MGWILLAIVGLGGVWLALYRYLVRGADRAIRHLAERHSLVLEDRGARGEVDDCEVLVRRDPRSPKDLIVEVQPPFELPAGLSVTPRRADQPDPERGKVRPLLHPIGGGRGVLAVGQPAFDDDVRIATDLEDANAVLARLTYAHRDALYVAVDLGFRLENGGIRAQFDCGSDARTHEAIEVLVDAARALRPPDDPATALRDLAATDPVPSVARRALDRLLSEDLASRDWLEAVASHPNGPDHVRFMAARHLDHRAALLSLVEAGGRYGALAAAVLSCDATHPDFDADLPRFRAALEAGLQEHVDPPVFEALGRVGEVGCVPALRGVARRQPGLRHDVERAIAAIQQRSVGGHGHLSLAASEGGQLSEAPDAGRPPQ